MKRKIFNIRKNRLIFVLLMLMVVVWSGSAWAEEQRIQQKQNILDNTQSATMQTMQISDSEGWKDLGNGWEEMQIETGIKFINNYPTNYISDIYWCNEKIILKTIGLKDATGIENYYYGYYLVDINNKSASEIQRLRNIDIGGCSPDGLYLFFQDVSKRSKDKTGLFLYDIAQQITYELYSFDVAYSRKRFHIVSDMFSPNMEYILGPDYLKDLKLPDGRVVKAVPYFDIKGDIILNDFFMWGGDGHILIKDGRRILREIKGKNEKDFLIKIKNGKDFFGCIGISRLNKIYCSMVDERVAGYGTVDEYDLTDSDAIDNTIQGLNPRTIIDNVGYWEISFSSAISSDGIVFGRLEDKQINIYFIDRKGNKNLLIRYNYCEHAGDPEYAEYDPTLIPVISYDGETVAVIDNCSTNLIRIFKKIKK